MLPRCIAIMLLVSTIGLTACAPTPLPPGEEGRPASVPPAVQPARQKTIVLGLRGPIDAMPFIGQDAQAYGWYSAHEIYAQGLITADRDTRRPVPRLATKVPSLDDGTIAILPDGRVKTVYPLRTDVTWHDGTPFTAQDLAFSFELAADRGLPKPNATAINRMDVVEAPDDRTAVLYWKAPFYQADSVGLRAFWPAPRHLLEQPYRTLDATGFINLPYWTTAQYIHLGPFRLAEVRPGEEMVYTAYDGYFLGRPKVDRILMKIIDDEQALYAASLAGAIDLLLDNSLSVDLGLELKERWEQTGQGTVYVGMGTTRFIGPQFDPAYQAQPAALDPRVRQALTLAIDRKALAEVIQRGHGELIANSLLPPGDRFYDAAKDGFARYTYDPTRAKALLGQLGWSPGSDGVLVGSGGARFTTTLWTTEGNEPDVSVIGDYWKQIGVAAEQYVVPRARAGDREYRQSYPGFEVGASGSADSILNRFESGESSTAPRFTGSNRGHYVNAQMDQLINRYRQSMDERTQSQAIKGISDLVADELPVMLLYFNATRPAVRKGIKAFDDFAGGAEGSQLYGSFSRNAHEWDVL